MVSARSYSIFSLTEGIEFFSLSESAVIPNVVFTRTKQYKVRVFSQREGGVKYQGTSKGKKEDKESTSSILLTFKVGKVRYKGNQTKA